MTERELAAHHRPRDVGAIVAASAPALARVLEKIRLVRAKISPTCLFFAPTTGGGITTSQWPLARPARGRCRLHDQYHDTKPAESIAWFMIKNGLGGECEGFLACYVRG